MLCTFLNNTTQHAQIIYYRISLGGALRHASIDVPMGATVEFDVPSSDDDDQRGHIEKQCKTLGVHYREGKL